jgi:hypothetical protein
VKLPFEVIQQRLALYLGPHTARSALRTFAGKELGITPEEVTVAQATKLLDALRPMLKTLLGATQCDHIVQQLTVELTLHS